jgi:putative heme-binding domain-containing protein
VAAFRSGPSSPEIGAALHAGLKNAAARYSLVGADLQATFRRFPGGLELSAPLVAELLHQAVAKDSRVTELEKIAMRGDAKRGQAAFIAGAGACITCHRAGDTGGRIGPDLSHIGGIRNARDLVEAIAFPNATIARGYESFTVQTRTGEAFTGTIPRETAEQVIVATGDGQERALPRTTIAKIEPNAVSLMPPGLDRALEPETLADLVAFLRSLK